MVADKELKEIKFTEIKAVNCSLKKADYKTVLHHFGVKKKKYVYIYMHRKRPTRITVVISGERKEKGYVYVLLAFIF